MEVYDLEEAVKCWAKKSYREKAPFSSPDDVDRMIENMEIGWEKVRTSVQSTDVDNEELDSEPVSNIVLNTEFMNKMSVSHKLHLKMDKTTEATVRTSLTKGFSKNGQVGLKIAVPDEVRNLTTDFGSDVTLASDDTNVVKETISWGLAYEVTAPPNMKTLASMKIAEKKYKCDFVSKVVLRGKVLIRILSEDPPTVLESQLSTILEDTNQDLEDYGLIRIDGKRVTWSVSGDLQFRFGVCTDTTVWNEKN